MWAIGKFFPLVMGLLVIGAAETTAAGLTAPVDVEARRALVGRPLAETPCPAAPAPLRDLRVTSYYSDDRHSVVDPARKMAHDAAVKPLHAFANGVARFSDQWLEARPPQPQAARCALAWLDAWAQTDAMLGTATSQGGYERKWTFGGIALAYLKIRGAEGLDPAAKARVEAWFGRLGAAVRHDYDGPRARSRTSGRNNHLYWAALAVAAGAIATGNPVDFDWAMEQYRFALTQIKTDGTLPLELTRGRRALHYHLFALAPLVMLAEIGMANGYDLYAERDGALARLVARVVKGLDDPAEFAKRAGVAQEVERLSGSNLAWAEIWYARRRDPAVLALITRHRPGRNSRLGGDLTLAFGVPDLAAR